MRGSPLAMLAAQCNKLTTKSPPPLADAAVGKQGGGGGGAGFHPWKKSTPTPGVLGGGQSLTGGSGEDNHSTGSPGQPSSPAQSSYSAHSTASPTPQYGKLFHL